MLWPAPAFFGRQAGHGPDCTDENHAVFTPQAKAVDNNNSLLQLLDIAGAQQPQQSPPAARECILTITETRMPACQTNQPAQQSQVATKGQQQPRVQLTSFLVVNFQDDLSLHSPIKALQSTVSCLCHRQRKTTQHIRTLKLLCESSVCVDLPTD